MNDPEIHLEDISSYTPEMLFEHFAERKGCVFLDGQTASKWSQFGILGVKPFAIFTVSENEQSFEIDNKKQVLSGCPFKNLKQKIQDYSFDMSMPGIPCLGAAIGYISYEASHAQYQLKHKKSHLPKLCFGFYNQLVIFNYLEKKTFWVQVKLNSSQSLIPFSHILSNTKAGYPSSTIGNIIQNSSKDNFIAQVKKAQAYIKEGDIYQVNLSQRFEAEYSGSLADIYLQLRRYSPAPFSAFLNVGPLKVLSSSPERFIDLQDRLIQTRPIKGTVPRGNSPLEDLGQRKKLLNSEKDQAELMMIIDLMRHDLGKICELGSVKVPKLYDIETYAQVFHLVSTIEGKLKPSIHHVEAIHSMFPAGSITGAPKKRAMQIINELEKQSRSIYTGTIGYFGFNHRSSFSVAIRCLYATNKHLYFHAGSGITAASKPKLEWEETLAKVKGIYDVLKLAKTHHP